MRFAIPAAGDRSHTAVKALVAAGLAWELGRTFGPGRVAYFAPVTALVAIHPVVARSLRGSLHYGASVIAGVLLAAAVGAVAGANLLGIVLVVGIGALLGAARPFGEGEATIGFWGLLVLLVGGTDPAGYLVERLPEAALGLAVGAAVNLALVPRVRLRPAGDALEALRAELSAALAAMAEDLHAEDPPSEPAWADAGERLGQLEAATRAAIERAEDSVQWNPRATVRGRRPWIGRTRADFRTLELVGDATRAIARTLEASLGAAEDPTRLDDDFRATYAALLAELAPVVEGSGTGDRLERTGRVLHELELTIGRRRHEQARSWLSEALLLVELDHIHTGLRMAA
jgi:hypothetical protein